MEFQATITQKEPLPSFQLTKPSKTLITYPTHIEIHEYKKKVLVQRVKAQNSGQPQALAERDKEKYKIWGFGVKKERGYAIEWKRMGGFGRKIGIKEEHLRGYVGLL